MKKERIYFLNNLLFLFFPFFFFDEDGELNFDMKKQQMGGALKRRSRILTDI